MIGLLIQLGVNYAAFKKLPTYALDPYKKLAIVAFPALNLAWFVLSNLVTFSWADLFSLKNVLITIIGPVVVQFCVNIFFPDWLKK